jgi:hypothetical protein
VYVYMGNQLEMGSEVGCLNLAYNRDQWRALVNTAVKFWVR